MVDEEGGHPGLSGAQQAFPGLEALLTVPFSFIAKYTHNKKEAEALVQISLLAVRLDSLLDSLRVAADHAARARDSSSRLLSLCKEDPRVTALLPLLDQLQLQRRHDLTAYQEEVRQCTLALERHKELLGWSAGTHSSTAEQVGEMMPVLADAAMKMSLLCVEMVARLDTLLQGRTSLYRACRRRPTDLLSSTPSWITMADFVRDIVTRDTPPGGPSPPSLAQTSPVPARTDGPESASSPSLQASCEASSSQTTAGREEGREAGRRGGRECPGKKRVGGSEAGGEEEKSWEGAGVNSRRSKRIARGGDEDGNRIGGNGDGGSWERGWEEKNVVGGEAPALEEAREVGKEGGKEVWVGGSLGGPGEGGQEGGTQVSESRTAWSEGEAEEEGRKESKEGRVKDTAEQGRVGKEGSVSDRCFSSRGKALPFRMAGAEGSDLAAGQVSEQREERVDTEASRDLGGIGRDVQGKGHQNRDDKGEGRERGGEVQVFDEAEAVDGLDTAGLSTGDMICPTKIVSCEEERAGAPEDSEGGTPSQ